MDEHTTSPHRRAWDSIPWVVAGSASDADRQHVMQHAAACAECREELAFHRQIRAGMLAPVDAHADHPAAHDAGPALQRIWARVDRAEAMEKATADAANADVSASALPTLPHRAAARSGRLTRWLAAAAVLQAIGIAALLGILWERPRAADYQTLSRPALPRASPAVIRLVPIPTLQLGELRALLARHGLQIVETNGDGSLLGVTLRAGEAAPGTDAAGDAVERAVQRLRAEPGVLLAEPVADAHVPRR